MGAHYCAVCRQTTFVGKGHIYGKSHQSRLRVVLLKFLEKVKEARRTLKKPQVEKFDGTQHKETFWCYCCGLEVERNVTDGNMSVLHGGLIEHMVTPEHRRNTHKFWWENKAETKFRDKFIFTEEESERFKTEVAKALESFVEEEDEFIKQNCMTSADVSLLFNLDDRSKLITSGPRKCIVKRFFSLFQSSGFTPQGSNRPAGSVDDDGPWSAAGQGLTFIGYQDSSNGGNVHTGAVPPWFQDDPLEGSSGTAAHAQIGPSLQDFLKHKEQEKLRKLPPNRVGANFDHSSHTDANWLPSFGRVWNSGRRWQSRHQFRQEEGQNRKKRRKEHGTEGSKKAKTEQMTGSDKH
ncbi:Coiled-coil domain-containing protein 84 [Takifugu flavidus]|uniref:Coiled-coil domain-containing protein 84 n=1 Tax=Takifugu flavidus TaxID=433684 RepID=A0A5C6MZ46_9TELE|nr:Coiled-coil domain-containing protein 84 [Takifugu flavidus]